MNELEQRLNKVQGLLALQLQAREVSRLITRDTRVPPGWLALAKRSDGRVAVVPAEAELQIDSSDPLSLFKAGPICLSIKASPIRTAEGHEIAATVTLRVAVRPNANDLNALQRQFLTRNKSEIEAVDIEKYLEEHVLVGARVFCRGRSTADNLAPATAGIMADHIGGSLDRALLSVGLSLVPGMMVSCIPVNEAAISFMTATATAGQEVLHKALLGQFEDLAHKAAESGQAEVGEALLKLRDKVSGQVAFTTFEQVMQVLPEKIRFDLHEAMLKILGSVSVERLVAVAGSQVICWKLPETAKPAWTTVLPADMGGGRSIRICRDSQGQSCVLVGCQKGITVLEAATGKPTAMLQEPYRSAAAAGSGGGFNSAILHGKQCWASKSDVGLLCWDMARPGSPWSILPAGKNQSVRFVRSVMLDGEGAIWFGGDNWLLQCASALPTAPDLKWFVPLDAAVTCIEVDGEDIWVGTQSGSLWRISQHDPRSVERMDITPGQAVEAVTVRRTGLVRWIFYADGRSAVVRTVNGLYSHNFTGNGGIRAAKTGGTWVAGLTDWRDELCIWTCGMLDREVVRVNVQRITNTRIQDFDLG